MFEFLKLLEALVPIETVVAIVTLVLMAIINDIANKTGKGSH